MGKRGHKKHQGPRRDSTWQNIPRENAKWETYYRKLGIVPESEFDQLKEACQKDLPLTFRITGTRKHAVEVRESIENDYISELQNVEWEGQKIAPPKTIAFYPDRLAWQVDVGKQVIRKNKAFARFQRFLVVETAVGNISRQEAVSMIPPLLLDVEPHHTVLDMCAAPGSKTSQLVEALHTKLSETGVAEEVKQPSGLVIANDSDYKRSHMLIHQVKRLNSPNLIVTNHDAQLLPKIKLADRTNISFDRVLCDVPCSGDGTMRKNINVWKDWGTGNGLGLHALQVNILARGTQVLKTGGRLVYSTCSMNPIENEAVVAEILRRYPSMRLVDVSDRLPGLVRSQGMSQWPVQAKNGSWFEKPEDVPAGGPQLARSLFEPTPAEREKFHLDRCVRVYPHQQNTGGFFITVFEKSETKRKREDGPESSVEPNAKEAKVAQEEAESAEVETEDKDVIEDVQQQEAVTAEPGLDTTTEESTSKKLPRDANEEPFKFLDPHHATLDECWKFYGIDDSFPRDSLLVRNASGEPVRTIYFVAAMSKPVLELNPGLRVVHAGIKLFVQQKNEDTCKWRVQSEGVELLYPFVGPNRVVHAQRLETLKTLCEEAFPKFNGLEEIDTRLKEDVLKITEGCCFLIVPRQGDEMLFPMWRGKASVNLMLPKQDAQEVLHRIFGVENVRGDNEAKEATPLSETTSQEPNNEPVAN